ncbi:MAG: hypothetical protein RML36_10180 [Anaerolineae bacterium]|nr:hypothetical protein [Anaerolineae bacterium]
MAFQSLEGIALIAVGVLFLLPALVGFLSWLFGRESWFFGWPLGARLAIPGLGIALVVAGLGVLFMPEAFLPPKAVTPTPIVILPSPTSTPTVTATPTHTPTKVPSPSPTATATATPTDTPIPTPAPALVPTPTFTPQGDCAEPIVRAILAAGDAQARYIEGRLSADDLAQTWGGAAGEARRQADRMIQYRAVGIRNIQISRVSWQLVACRVVETIGEDRVRVVTEEHWTYEANLDCGQATLQPSIWLDRFPAEEYVLVRQDSEWRIEGWAIGQGTKPSRWQCP